MEGYTEHASLNYWALTRFSNGMVVCQGLCYGSEHIPDGRHTVTSQLKALSRCGDCVFAITQNRSYILREMHDTMKPIYKGSVKNLASAFNLHYQASSLEM